MAYSYDDYEWCDDMPYESVEDETWLDRNYGGAPDECSWHFIHVGIVKLVNGKCPRQSEHHD